jgi:hypothetical protein
MPEETPPPTRGWTLVGSTVNPFLRGPRPADMVRTRNAAVITGPFHVIVSYWFIEIFGAATVTRTPDPLITNEVLYQLSYCGCIFPKANTNVLQLTS